MGLKDIGATLPPGFRFYPSDEELVCHYLYKKIASGEVSKDTLVEIDLHTCEPWQLPDVAKLNANEWYFFNFRDRKYATGFRANRATTSGYWKATGKDRTVIDPRTRSMVGMRKTLVFYKNRAPNGIKTGWIMHEFRLENPHMPPKEDWVLCRVFHKAKADNNIGDSSDVYDNIRGGGGDCDGGAISPPYIDDHHHAIIMGRGYNQNNTCCFSVDSPPHQCQNCSNCFPNLPAQLDRNYLQLSPEIIHHDHRHAPPSGNANQMVHFKSEEESGGFFFDIMNFGEPTLKAGVVPSSLEEMQFDDDTGSVFI